MTLTQAMRRGAKMAPQIYGSFSDGYGGCALELTALGADLYSKAYMIAAALDGCPVLPNGLLFMYPVLQKDVDSPCKCPFKATLWHAIMHMNDRHRWSAERIAGWLEAHIETPTYSGKEIGDYMQQTDEASEPLDTSGVPRV